VLQIAVCDDSQEELNLMQAMISEYAQKHPDIEISTKTFISSDTLITEVENGLYFDIYFLDIIMPGTNGMELAGFLRSIGHKSCIVFTTNSPDFSLQAYGVGAIQYLLKPIDQEGFFQLMAELTQYLKANFARSLVIDTKNGLIKIPCHTIMYAEVRNHTSYIHLSDKRIVESKSMRLPFLDFIAPLLAEKRFIIPHNSYVLNMDYISRMSTKEFELSDGRIIPITRARQKEVRETYLSYVSDISNLSNLHSRGKPIEP